MRVVVRMADLQGAPELISVSQAHIDGCVYTGPASLELAEKLVAMGGSVRVPTTLNAISVDRRRWRALGVPADLGEPASALADAYLALGCAPSFTCAPYLLDSAPSLGEQVTWGESNAVVFANSVLGARTQKYADFLDICIALTGRAPLAGAHLDAGRRASVVLALPRDGLGGALDDAFWPVLGYLAGLRARKRTPAITGLEHTSPSRDDLKALCAAFGTTGSGPMLHLVGVTPEAPDLETALGLGGGGGAAGAGADEEVETIALTREDLEAAWHSLDAASSTEAVELVALGNPHLSADEVARVAELCRGRRRHPGTSLVLTFGRSVQEQASKAGHIQVLEDFGATLVNDTCWCMLTEPVVPPESKTLITNSAKYAHYAPGLVNRQVRFHGLAGCVDAACSGRAPTSRPGWLAARGFASSSPRAAGAATGFWPAASPVRRLLLLRTAARWLATAVR